MNTNEIYELIDEHLKKLDEPKNVSIALVADKEWEVRVIGKRYSIWIGNYTNYDETIKIAEIVSQYLTSKQFNNTNEKQVNGTHYKSKIQCWDYIIANNIGYLEGNVIKYVTRHKSKGGRADILKAIHYLEKILEVEYGVEE